MARAAAVVEWPCKCARGAEPQADERWFDLLLLPELKTTSASSSSAVPPAFVPEELVAAKSGGAASSHEQPPAPVLASQDGAAPDAGSGGSGGRRWLEGRPVTLDSHGSLGHARYYERATVRCTVHPSCTAQRSFAANVAMASGLGDQEPYCF